MHQAIPLRQKDRPDDSWLVYLIAVVLPLVLALVLSVAFQRGIDNSDDLDDFTRVLID
jgi:hypothetical protein